ncbi:MarR family winged helix-turn-helix transcriptional regulator [Klebsiella quasipneumoniae]|uniref:MarR family winged helix-turn-helix transcriptional regulator n=1 Tax=Klebsiella quasipneumoniae TaxID=1463165 RepID=UPI002D7F7240|nr:MarR family transcriptional regulator [Klebsiella quasipneumoniae]MEB4700969.1 MarR family transcriptional regulator [Klebsiella quasipneumoniae]HBS1667371.1 MarR family transcriptional regulator [Klebsiella quasipneumoniae subsp. quasipneumoniae]
MDHRQLNFSHLLYLTAHHWRLAVNRRLKNLGLSQASWVAVAAIARHHQPLSQSELAQELGVESPTIVPLINRLVALGLVERVTTDRDKRKRLLVVTDQGQALFEQVKTVADDLREEILTVITPQEREQTQRVLEKLLREVEKK